MNDMNDSELGSAGFSSRKFLWWFFTSCLVISVLLVGVNYGVDRYGVFHAPEGSFSETLEPNTRFLKAAYLDKACSEHNAMIMGSSRDVGYLTSEVDRVFGVKAYNYGVAAGNLRGILPRLEWLESKGCFPSHIFLPLSLDKLRLPQRPDDLLRKEHPDIVDRPGYRREFLLSYIGTDAFVSNARKLIRQLRGKSDSKFLYNLPTGDVTYLWDREFEIGTCLDRNDSAEPPVIREFIEFLFAIESLADRNGATLTLFLNPQPLGFQLAYVTDAALLFDQMADRFDSIYRLPLSDPRLIDSSSYHDRGHFKHELGTAVISDRSNQVSLDQLLVELKQAALACE